MMEYLTLQVRHTDALEDRLKLNFRIENDATYGFTLNDGIIVVSDSPDAQATTTLDMDRAVLDNLASGLLTFNQAIASGVVKVTGDGGPAERLASLMKL